MYIEQRDECGPLMYRSCEVCSHVKVRSPPAHPLRACWESSVLRSVALPLVGASLSRESHAHSGVMLMAGPRPPSPGSFHIRGFLTTIVDWKKRVGKGGGGSQKSVRILARVDRPTRDGGGAAPGAGRLFRLIGQMRDGPDRDS